MNSKNKKTVILVFFCRIYCKNTNRTNEPVMCTISCYSHTVVGVIYYDQKKI